MKKKYISILMCVIMLSFVGCEKTTGIEELDNTSKSPKENTVNDSNEISQKDIISNVNKEQEGNNFTDKKNEQSDNIKFEVLENYKEKNIPSVYLQGNGKEYYSNVCLDENRRIKYYTYSEDENGSHIWKYTIVEDVEDAENPVYWEREAVSWTEGIAKEIAHGQVKVFLGQDGREYAWYLGVDEKTHFVKQEGDSFVEIKGLDWEYSEHIEPNVLKNGNIVCTDLERKCSLYNPEDGSLLKQFPCGFYQSLCVDGNQIYVGDQIGASVQHYNAEKNEFGVLLESGFETTIRIAAQDDDVYVCTQKGIYRTKRTGGEFQKILDSGTYHFAKDAGNLLKFFVIGDAFYVLYGEDGGAIKKYFSAGENDLVAKTINVYSLESNDVILDMISEFQDMYPDTEIIYETGEGADGSITVADGIRALNTRIMAGDGPDVLVLDGLPIEAYIKKGILSDLNPVLGERKNELLPSVLSAYDTEGKMYMLPARISFPMFLTSGQESSVYASLKSFVEYSEAEGGVLPEDYSYKDYLEILYYNYPPELIAGDGTVNRKELSEFLELTRRLCESEKAVDESGWMITYLEGRGSAILLAKEEADFLFVLMNDVYALDTYAHAVELREGATIQNGNVFFPTTVLGINHLSEKEELAETFLQFAFSNEIQGRSVGKRVGYPIDVKVLDKFAQVDRSEGVLSSGGFELRYSTQKENKWMIQIVKEKLHTPFTVDASVWQILEEEGLGYFKGKKSLEDSVDAIASRVQLYLYEQ